MSPGFTQRPTAAYYRARPRAVNAAALDRELDHPWFDQLLGSLCRDCACSPRALASARPTKRSAARTARWSWSATDLGSFLASNWLRLGLPDCVTSGYITDSKDFGFRGCLALLGFDWVRFGFVIGHFQDRFVDSEALIGFVPLNILYGGEGGTVFQVQGPI